MEVFKTRYELPDKPKHIQQALELDKAEIINIQLRTSEVLKEHHAKVDVLIIVRSGLVEFTVEGERVKLTSERILHINAYENHHLLALEDTDLLVIKLK